MTNTQTLAFIDAMNKSAYADEYEFDYEFECIRGNIYIKHISVYPIDEETDGFLSVPIVSFNIDYRNNESMDAKKINISLDFDVLFHKVLFSDIVTKEVDGIIKETLQHFGNFHQFIDRKKNRVPFNSLIMRAYFSEQYDKYLDSDKAAIYSTFWFDNILGLTTKVDRNDIPISLTVFCR